MHSNNKIFLGDLVRAIRKLKATDWETQRKIAEMLGMTLIEKVIDGPSAGTDALNQEGNQIRDSQPADTTPAPEDDFGDSIPITIQHNQGEKDEWIKEVEPLPAPSADSEYVPPKLEPLFLPQWTRAILSAALVTSADDGLPDIERITETIARGEAVRELPVHSSPTVRRGVQLLVDKSQAMMPFARDQAWLQKELRNVVGTDRVQVKRFVGSPLRGIGLKARSSQDYDPPLPGTPVVLLTDLGICQPMLAEDWADSQEWLQFSLIVRHAHCPLIALVPYGPSRWPPELLPYMTIIQWDRNTTAPIIRSIIGDGLKVATT
jgi:hypothetical protein